jgi:VIT family protein
VFTGGVTKHRVQWSLARRAWSSSPKSRLRAPVPCELGRSERYEGLAWSSALTCGTIIIVGASPSLVTADWWWMAGLEMLLLGIGVAVAAFGSGRIVSALTSVG